MNWPNGSDYNDAIQNPQANLKDELLRRGAVVWSPQRMPTVYSGNMASVFPIQEGGRTWAVKCFTRYVKDLQERYAAISEHLKANRPATMVDFDYQREGILVHGTWHPILRMQWVDGPLLDKFVGDNLGSRQALMDLATKWIDCVTSLRQANLAHGDLQFGNIKIVGSDIKLFDYDGMYVPAIRSRGSSEYGHRHFQHPKRSPKDFDLYIDHFPAWVIYVSLVAVAEHPTIWKVFDGGDDCLIFRNRDFERPASSRLFDALEKVGSPELRADLARLKDYAQRPPNQVPSLDSVKRDRRVNRSTAGSTRGTPGWATPFIEEQSATHRATKVVNLVRSTRAPELNQSRLVVVAAIGLWLASAYLGGLAWFPATLLLILPVLALGSFVLLLVFYHRFANRLAITPQEAQRRLAAINAAIGRIESQRQMLREKRLESEDEVRNAGLLLGTFDLNVKKERDEWDHRREDMQRLHSAESERLDQTASIRTSPAPNLLARREALIAELTTLESKRRAQLAILRRDVRKPFIEERLRGHSVTAASILGLGEYGRSQLEQAGFRTALDILSGRSLGIFGLGQREREGLLAWAQVLRGRAEQDAPEDLPPQQVEAVNAAWDTSRSTLESERGSLEVQITDSERSRREEFATERRQLLQQHQAALQQYEQDRSDWDRAIKRQREDLEKAELLARQKRASERMDAAAKRSEFEVTEKMLSARQKECTVGQELGKGLTFRLFLESLLPKRP